MQEFWDEVIPEAPVWNWHIKYLCDELQIIAERVFQNKPKLYDLIINISPGSTKSIICSIMYPAWIWTRMHTAVIITGSYVERLALKLSLKCRDVITSEKYKACFPAITLRKDQNAKSLYMNTNKGEKIACSVNGNITGSHGHFILIDDPLDPEEAASELQLESANNWMSGTLSSRKKDKVVTPIILIMQRLHQNDCTNDMIERIKSAQKIAMRSGDREAKLMLKHICLPAEVSDKIKPPELENHYVNGMMDPIRLPRSVLNEQMAVGDYHYAGQYMQYPVPKGGGSFKTDLLNIETAIPDKWMCKMRFWDKAGTEGGKGAYTVGVLLGQDINQRWWVLDVIRERLGSFKREQLIKRTAMADGYGVLVGVEQEPGSGGKESAENTVKNLAGWTVMVDKPSGSDSSKELRAEPYSVQVNAGNVYLKQAEWNTDYINELKFFPRSTFKDQVDASSGAFNKLTIRKRRAGSLFKKNRRR